MKPKDLRDKTSSELEQTLRSLKEELFNLRYQAKTGRLEKPSLIRNIKRDIARINTVIKEKENRAWTKDRAKERLKKASS